MCGLVQALRSGLRQAYGLTLQVYRKASLSLLMPYDGVFFFLGYCTIFSTLLSHAFPPQGPSE